MLASQSNLFNNISSCKSIPWYTKNIAIIGVGRSGIAAAKLLKALGANNIWIIDQSFVGVHNDFALWAKKAGCKFVIGKHCPEQFEKIDIVIPSPGVAISKIRHCFKESIYILSETELAWHQLTNEKIIAITGTSGKTTTASLCGAMLDEESIPSFVGGNIGNPLSEYVLSKEKADVIVLELSSFQLQTCVDFRPDVAILLNISSNHLDYHVDMDEYVSAKMHICKKQNETDFIVIKQDLDALLTKHNVKSKKLLYQDTGMFLATKLIGSHNRENAEAAWTACSKFGVSSKSAQKAVEMFCPLEHRLEHVRNINGVCYINDSKGTTVEALSAALKAFEQPVLLLVGGVFKGGDLSSLRPIIQDKVRAIGLFGSSREVFEEAWGDLVLMHWDKSLEDAVKYLSCLASCGDVILLAPATSSFDQYKNYIERGKDFKRIVHEVLI